MKYTILFSLLIVLFTYVSSSAQIEYPKRELRGAWMATVKNIDWPSSNTETSGEQIAEMVKMMKNLKAAGINTVIFQVRTECDALYNSPYEPWSYWLTGKQGRAPKPYFDPLAFAVSEAHRLGMELHAWFNPYRAVRKVRDYAPAANHVSVTHPDWIITSGTGEILNPGIPAVRHYIAKIIGDVVRRYDVDGIHFDDYFYPYTPLSNQDSLTYLKYRGSFTNIDDWRRNNINQMVAEVYDTINAVNPRVKFGISPFGIVENKYAGTDGFESYYKIYCDPLNWLEHKTVDYITPQIYWAIGFKKADYAKLLPWWATVTNGRQLYIGLFSSKMAASDYKGDPDMIERQMRMNRSTPNVSGEVFFSAKSISNDYSNLADSLKYSLYKYPALIPTMPWKDSVPPLPPANLEITSDSAGTQLEWEKPAAASDGDTASQYVIYRFMRGDIEDINNPENIIAVIGGDNHGFLDTTEISGITYEYKVSALDKLSNESKDNPSIVHLK